MNTIHNPKRILFIILLCNIFFCNQLFSQTTYKRKISISEWIEEMEKCTDKEYYLSDTEIFYDDREDSLYSFQQPTNEPSGANKKSAKNIYPKVLIQNCKLPDNKTCQVRNLIFHENITFALCKGAGQLIFYNCTFKQGLDFQHSDFNTIQFMYCAVLHRTIVNNLQIHALSYSNCSFYTDQKRVYSPYILGIEEENKNYQYLFLLYQTENTINSFIIANCKLLPTEVKPVIAFHGGKYDVISFKGINFSNSIVDFTECSVKENFTVSNCTFNQPLGMHQFNFPKNNTSFHWSQLDSVGLGLYTDFALPPYTHENDTLISDVYMFNELNSSYRKFFSMYRTQGDIESANACFDQLKDMETGKYHYLYQQNPNTNNWFNWRFNQFLKYFSDYGTNPVKALIISMWVILLFALVYFFFYSEWDGINRSFLIKQHRKIMLYFRSEQRLEDFYTENYIDDFKTFTEYKKEMQEGKGELPLFIVIPGKPLYLFSMLKHKIAKFFYRKTEVLHGQWITLRPVRKTIVGSMAVFFILIYLIYLVLVRALNSTTLSINAFSTLGFGAIPVKGISRYITIIEGFLGWFLLSIFSVSLISQMLQN